jgi:hypothetical protein
MYASQSLSQGLHVTRTEPVPVGLLLTIAVALTGLAAFALSSVYVPGFATMVATALAAAG